ncbi:MAG: DUF2202 domain-containing protein, partial [Cyclobacteriaceae bacterium]|nr:DUF2202 domain-containing protein [Cyclobacteriaceae bacterium]
LIQLSACGQTTDEVLLEENGIEAVSELPSESNPFAFSIDQLPKGELTENEIIGLQFMREEEKMARDVYLTLYGQWSLIPFKHISKSEQVHMDAILNLLNRYELDDPAEGNEVGEFTNQDLQKLYDDLIERGSESAIEALMVGALIEEVDIIDIQRMIDEDFESEDVVFVMSNLLRGSGFHLKAFVWNLKKYNVDYTPVLLDEDKFNEILD